MQFYCVHIVGVAAGTRAAAAEDTMQQIKKQIVYFSCTRCYLFANLNEIPQRSECDLSDFEVPKASQNEVRSGFKSQQNLIMKAMQMLYRSGLRVHMKFDTNWTKLE